MGKAILTNAIIDTIKAKRAALAEALAPLTAGIAAMEQAEKDFQACEDELRQLRAKDGTDDGTVDAINRAERRLFLLRDKYDRAEGQLASGGQALGPLLEESFLVWCSARAELSRPRLEELTATLATAYLQPEHARQVAMQSDLARAYFFTPVRWPDDANPVRVAGQAIAKFDILLAGRDQDFETFEARHKATGEEIKASAKRQAEAEAEAARENAEREANAQKEADEPKPRRR